MVRCGRPPSPRRLHRALTRALAAAVAFALVLPGAPQVAWAAGGNGNTAKDGEGSISSPLKL